MVPFCRRGELAMPDELREQYDQLSSEQQEQLKGVAELCFELSSC